MKIGQNTFQECCVHVQSVLFGSRLVWVPWVARIDQWWMTHFLLRHCNTSVTRTASKDIDVNPTISERCPCFPQLMNFYKSAWGKKWSDSRHFRFQLGFQSVLQTVPYSTLIPTSSCVMRWHDSTVQLTRRTPPLQHIKRSCQVNPSNTPPDGTKCCHLHSEGRQAVYFNEKSALRNSYALCLSLLCICMHVWSFPFVTNL